MFTGIIQTQGKVDFNLNGRLRIRASLGRLPRGASVSINGVCLTTLNPTNAQKNACMDFDLSPETLRLTSLGKLRPGDRVNLEPSLRPSDLMGGHWVSGHVDAQSKITKITSLSNGHIQIRFTLPKNLSPFVALKGSIALDGTSLTVTRVGRGYFESVLVPHTLRSTTLGTKRAGDFVNLEVDVVARYIYRIIKSASVLK